MTPRLTHRTAVLIALAAILLDWSPLHAQTASQTPYSGDAQGVACSPNGALTFNGNSFVLCSSGAWAVQPITIGTASSAPFTCGAAYKGMLYFDTGANNVEFCNGSAWTIAGSGGTAAAAGSTGQVQFNSGGVLGANSNLFWDNTNYRLGIGTATPLEPLEINASLTQSSPGQVTITSGINSPANQYYIPGSLTQVTATLESAVTNQTITGTMGWTDIPSSNTNVVIDASGSEGIVTNESTVGGGTWNMTGADGEAFNYGTINFNGLTGTSGYAENDGTDNNSVVGGSFSSVNIGTASGYMNGAEAYADNASGTVSDGEYGFFSGAEIDGGAVTGGMYTLAAEAFADGGSVTGGLYGLYIYPEINGATVDNRYGLYIDDGGGSVTGNDYGIVQVATYEKNYFGGHTGIGAAPSSMLTVSGGGIDTDGYPSLLVTTGDDKGAIFRLTSTDTGGQGWNFASTGPGSAFAAAGSLVIFDSSLAARLVIAPTSGNIGIGSTGPIASLDLSQKTDALALPVGTTYQEPASPINGMIRYNTTLGDLEAYITGAWTTLTTGVGGTSAAGGTGQVQFNTAGSLNADSNFFWDNTNKRLGIGTATPAFPLNIVATDTSTTGAITVWSPDGTSTYPGALVQITAAPSADTSAATWITGVTGSVDVPVSNANSVLNAFGIEGHVSNESTTANNGNGYAGLVGIDAGAFNTGNTNSLEGVGAYLESDSGAVGYMIGAEVNDYIEGGTVSEAAGASFYAEIDSGTVTTNGLTGLDAETGADGGTVTGGVYGVYVYPSISGATVDNRYGVYIDDGGGSVTGSDYGLYQAATYEMNYFGGAVGIGTIFPTSVLHVMGSSANPGSGNAILTMQGNGSNGLLVGNLNVSPYSVWLQSGYLPGVGATHYSLALNPLGGSVGIGTAAPYYNLDVYNGWLGAAGAVIGADYDDATDSAPTNGLIVEASVGIGTTAPGKMLEVYNSTADFGNPTLRINGSATGNYNGTSSQIGTVEFYNNNSTNLGSAALIVAGRGQSANGSSELHFFTSASSASPKDQMMIDKNGNVGIGVGTTAPVDALNVVTKFPGDSHGITMQNTASDGQTELDIENSDDTAILYMGIDNASNNSYIIADGGTLSIFTESDSGIVIDTSGNVGIGTAAPQSMLHVYGGEVQIGSSGASCASNVAGAIRFSGTTLSYCNGTSWTSVSGGGTPGGSTTQVQYNSSGSFAGDSSFTYVTPGAVTLGVNASHSGSLGLANGNTTGKTVTIQNISATAGAYNFNLPTTAGAAGALFASGGGGSTATTWVTDVAAGELLTSQGTTSNPSYSATPTLGVNATTSGSLGLANGNTTGKTVTIQNISATAGAYNFNLPTTAGAAGAIFVSGGGGSTANAWVTDVAAGELLTSQGTTSNPSYSATPTLGIAGTTKGTLALTGNTSGTATITPQATAGTPTLTLPNASGTFAVSASSPLSLSATTGALTLGTVTVPNGGTGLTTLTSNVIYKGNGTGNIATSALTDNGTIVSSSESLDATSKSFVTEITNAGTTGTGANLLAKLTGAPSTAVKTATTDTGGAIGIVIGGNGTSGSAQIAIAGQANCVFENTAVAGDYVQIGSTTGGDCHDAGSTYPTSGQVVGRVLASGLAGTRAVALFGPEIEVASGGSGGAITLGTSVSVTNPSRASEVTTGLFSPASGAVAVSSLGTEKLRVTSNGVTIGSTAANYPLDMEQNPTTFSTSTTYVVTDLGTRAFPD